MDKKYFKLNVKIGTKIIRASGDYTIEGVPDDALTYYRNGSTWLGLKDDAVEGLQVLTETEIQTLIRLKKQQGFEKEVAILEKALKQKKKGTKKETEKSKSSQ